MCGLELGFEVRAMVVDNEISSRMMIGSIKSLVIGVIGGLGHW